MGRRGLLFVIAAFAMVIGSLHLAVPITSAQQATSDRASQPTSANPQATGPLLEFDVAQATAENGPPLSAEATRTCGAIDRRFLGELLQGSPLDFKIPFRLGDVTANGTKPSAADGRQYYLAGTSTTSSVGGGDFPFDHPFGSDFNMDVIPDAPYAFLSQLDGTVANVPQHVELGAGLFPHSPQPGGVDGETWPDNSLRARTNLQPGFVPQVGDRVIVAGRWVNDCGHNNPFQTELHPISFMGWAHEDAANQKTVSQAFYAPYRDSQRYNADPTVANKVYDTARFRDLLHTVSFPRGLLMSVVALGRPTGPEFLQSYGLIEANQTSPVDWKVCAPPTSTGAYVGLRYDFVARPGIDITYVPDHTNGCVTMHTGLGTQVTPDPPMHLCNTPWPFLNEVAAAEAGVPSLDLQAELKKFVPTSRQHRLDPAPVLDCYNPVEGPPVSPNPAAQNVTTDPNILSPFYGRVEVFRTNVAPPTSSTASSSTSSSTAAPTSSSSSTPTGQKLTVTPATVAAGGTITVESSGWTPGAIVTVTVGGITLGTLIADASGNVRSAFTLPSAISPGSHTVTASGTASDGKPLSLSAAITVTASTTSSISGVAANNAAGSGNSGSGNQGSASASGTLPTTGARIATIVAMSSVLVLFGLAIVAGLQRRRQPA